MIPSRDDDVVLRKDPNWYTSASSWLMVRKGVRIQRGSKETRVLSFLKTPEIIHPTQVTPWGLRSLLTWVKEHYGGLDLYITEVTKPWCYFEKDITHS